MGMRLDEADHRQGSDTCTYIRNREEIPQVSMPLGESSDGVRDQSEMMGTIS